MHLRISARAQSGTHRNKRQRGFRRDSKVGERISCVEAHQNRSLLDAGRRALGHVRTGGRSAKGCTGTLQSRLATSTSFLHFQMLPGSAFDPTNRSHLQQRRFLQSEARGNSSLKRTGSIRPWSPRAVWKLYRKSEASSEKKNWNMSFELTCKGESADQSVTEESRWRQAGIRILSR
jgi:hypothetical protein